MIRRQSGEKQIGIVLVHTTIPVNDRKETVEFYTRILGFEDLGEVGPFLAVAVNDTLNLDFRQSDDFRSIHYAFAMEAGEFDEPIRGADIAYGDSPFDMENVRGPGMTMGTQGNGKAVYFKDPNGHVLEIKTY